MQPIETYIDFVIRAGELDITSVRITFRIGSDVDIDKIKILSIWPVIKGIIGKVSATVSFSISELSIIYTGQIRTLPLAISLWKKKLEIGELTLDGGNRHINIWIEDHKASDPLVTGINYNLMINIAIKDLDASISDINHSNNNSQESPKLIISLSGAKFTIPTNTMELQLPNEGDSAIVNFKIKPNTTGAGVIEIFFYYELNLLMVLAVSLQVVNSVMDRPSHDVIRFKEQKFLNADVMASSDKGLDGILELKNSEL